MDEKDYDNKLDTVELEDVDLNSFFDHAKNGTLDQIENELAILDGISSIIPKNLAHLSVDEFTMLMLFCSNDIYCEYTNKKTLNDIVSSFIMTFVDSNTNYGRAIKYLIREAFFEDKIITKQEDTTAMSTQGDVESTKTTFIKKFKIKSMTKYLQLKSNAMSFWNKNNLQKSRKMVYDLLNGGVDDLEKFDRMVFDMAMNSTDDGTKARFASIYSKNKGLDKSKGAVIVNLFEKHGGKEMTQQLASATGNNLIDIGKVIDAEGDEDNE